MVIFASAGRYRTRRSRASLHLLPGSKPSSWRPRRANGANSALEDSLSLSLSLVSPRAKPGRPSLSFSGHLVCVCVCARLLARPTLLGLGGRGADPPDLQSLSRASTPPALPKRGPAAWRRGEASVGSDKVRPVAQPGSTVGASQVVERFDGVISDIRPRAATRCGTPERYLRPRRKIQKYRLSCRTPTERVYT